jgi:hypothetical protein
VSNDQKRAIVFTALCAGQPVEVTTTSRQFIGRVVGLYRSVWGNDIRADVVDDEGRMHGFYVTKADAVIRLYER